ncbi:YitT family protein [Sporosarcina sp. ACRSL]|uniref:YitT family protein n=1 Tax=Sporosarcina sp. ACRSL TaxID=2918215 RepID=UPI001EF502AE|nr:YitT family protein [Sporosarcina sp. ACRSL]
MKRKNRRQPAKNISSFLRKYILVAIGAVIQGFAMGVFLFPNYIPSGGAGGLTVLLNYWFGIPLSLALWIMNASMLLFAFHYLGGKSTIGTLFGITITSISVNLFEVSLNSPFSTVLLDLLFGSIFLGTGIAVLLRQGVSNGGVGVIALIIAKYKKINPGKSLFWINGVIFVITGYVIVWEIIIQALICQWVSTTIVKWLYNVRVPRKRVIIDLIWGRD